MGRAGVRASWETIPAPVRERIDEIAGAAVVRATNLDGGFSPGPAARCDLADGSRVFVKAVGPELNPDSPRFHRREIAVLRTLPADHPAPRLLGWVDDDGWVALVTGWIDARMPTAPLSHADVGRFLRLAERLVAVGAGVAPDGVGTVADVHPHLFGHWRRLAERGAGEPTDRLDPVLRDRLDELVALEDLALDATAGDHLLHVDLRTDNVLFADDGVDVVVDWPAAAIGAPWLDLVLAMPALHLDGGPGPSEAFAATEVGRRADRVDRDAVDAVLCGFAGFLLRRSLLPPPPGLPTLRTFQANQARIAMAWLDERLARRG